MKEILEMEPFLVFFEKTPSLFSTSKYVPPSRLIPFIRLFAVTGLTRCLRLHRPHQEEEGFFFQ
ncbi:hypothetical protein E2C01_052477 [Portunus trituberculatus]|uniref:Uncharacterized protein n=1 Tax=Portunus trituberculatus TaxID=210409 RepID=A0A5B7GHM9_PORTR|nr:hypothetical protein [Portunus trituberculatus]